MDPTRQDNYASLTMSFEDKEMEQRKEYDYESLAKSFADKDKEKMEQKQNDYGDLVKSLAEENLCSEHFSDLRAIEHGEYLKAVKSYFKAHQELSEAQYEQDHLIRTMQEYTMLDKRLSKEHDVYKDKAIAIEKQISEVETACRNLTLDHNTNMAKIVEQYDVVKKVYNPDYIKKQMAACQKKIETAQKVYERTKRTNEELKKNRSHNKLDMPDFEGVFDEVALKTEIDDLSANQQRLFNISKNVNQLKEKIAKLKRGQCNK